MIRRDKKHFLGILLGVGVAATLVSGLLLLLAFSHPNNAYLSGPGAPTYGLPFPWMQLPYSLWGPINWLSFLADLSFYMALGYMIVINMSKSVEARRLVSPGDGSG